jgi:A/G-specific adenine glycosylase
LRAIAFDRSANVIDGNVERVIARLFAIEEPLPRAKSEIKRLAATLLPDRRAGDYAQALMDLGAMVCTPRSPGCLACPWASLCEARRLGIAAELPRRLAAKPKPVRYGVVFWLEREDGAVLLRRRPDKGLLGGMIEVPSGPWVDALQSLDEAAPFAPAQAAWRPEAGMVSHGFTHFDIGLAVVRARIAKAAAPDGLWAKPEEFHRHALPTLTKKVVRHVLGAGWGKRAAPAQATWRVVSG